ncbi:MAG: hypothetical protein ACYCSJ_06270 [Acidimicrobiales bacterium]
MTKGDRWGLLSLIGLPLAAFVVPALFGHLMAPGDDLTQNLPLRMLVGADLRAGHLPLWNPYIWSGTPLLAGFNAGALYPATLLFAVLPAGLAWAVGQAITYALAGTGVLLLARRMGAGALPAWLAGFCFAWSGFMMAQLRHIGLVEGMAWAGWILLGLDHLSRPDPGGPDGRRARRRRVMGLIGWSSLTGLAVGLVGLAGDPRSVSDLAVAAGLFFLWALWRRPAGRVPLLVGGLGAAVLAGMLAAGQFLPGLAAYSGSQRAGVSLIAFGAGSLHPAELLFMVFPFLAGGLDSLRFAPYFGGYNLPELLGYIGILGLAGALAALAGRLRPPPGPLAARPGPAFWGVMAGVGVMLAFGSYTPLAHVLVHVPLYDGQRLQSRNLGEVDLALTILFAYWARSFLEAWRRPGRLVLAAGLLGPVAVPAVVVAAWIWPGGMADILQSPVHLFPAVWPFAIASLGLAGLVGVIFVFGHRWSRRARAVVLVAVTLADVGFFGANAATGWVSTSYLSARSAGSMALAGALPPGARFAVYDPDLFYPAYINGTAGLVPVPDLNVIAHLPSVQGYGSLVAGAYEDATGTHTEGSLDPSLIQPALASRLDLGLLLIEPHEDQSALESSLISLGWTPRPDISGLHAWRAPGRIVTAGLAALSSPGRPGAGAPRPPGTVSCSRPNPVGGGANCTVTVTAPGPVRLDRSQAYAPGWIALVSRNGGPQRQMKVFDHELLQAVDLPGPGLWRVSFRYRPSLAFAGLVLTGIGGLAGLLGLLGLAIPARPARWRPGPR